MEDKFHTPWRVAIMTDTLEDLSNSSLISDLNPEAEGDFSWVEPELHHGHGGRRQVTPLIMIRCMITLIMRRKPPEILSRGFWLGELERL